MSDIEEKPINTTADASTTDEQSSKKRNLELSEIEIDLAQTAPLSKKQKRLLRKGKLDIEQLAADQRKEAEQLIKNAQKEASEGGESKKDGEEATSTSEATESKEDGESKKKQRIGVWVGNMSFDTEKDDIIRFITSKTASYAEYSKDLDEGELVQVTEKNITRVNLPTQGKNSKKIKGFAYIDFTTAAHRDTVISLSESQLNGRNLLIKNSDSFEGRPAKEEGAPLSKNPPSRILFVGNLSFDTTNESLTEHFQHCGEIIKIRMATFEDTGKCKGFAFIDFRDEEGPTNALKDKSCRKIVNRPLRLEFGEDRSKRNPGSINKQANKAQASQDRYRERSEEQPTQPQYNNQESEQQSRPPRDSKPKPLRKTFKRDAPQERQKSSIALANAQRASAAIVKSTGVKKSFD
ncbi:hypothetical protein WICPIJ_001184 [Wickerhamomyces pijperi]|uniref:RRM domain-containing protein n=1 Tax=Wickerhamomyces pijperi TaxID=599730 RepID=A0A9P8QE97_WICPI|nr:hypothetical protein WICPIJ_001184 [Wickerhamomyces pijperi]